MKKKLKEKWVAALRSGEYCQTEGSLIDEHGYCCLGVLCDVAGIPQNEDEDFVDRQGCKLGNLGSSPAASVNLIKRGGLNGVLSGGVRQSLAMMNDNGATFDEIADEIEENL